MVTTPGKSPHGGRRTLYIAICSDCDPDRESYGGASYGDAAGLRWEGVREGVARARDLARAVGDEAGCAVPLTWCVRSDAQMAAVYGDAAWAYREFADTWNGLTADGHEIAWHPHVWRWDDAARSWYQELADEGWTRECLAEGHRALHAAAGGRLRTCRTGWEFHSDCTMRTVAGLGIAYDCSAIPGWFAAGEASHGSRFHCFSDWRGTPRGAYRPSREDYRRAAADGEEALGICEIPMSTFTSGAWGGIRTVRRAVRLHGLKGAATALRADTWRPAQVKAYVTIRPGIFRRLISEQLRSVLEVPTGVGYLLTAFHPDELLGGEPGRLYSAANFATNLRATVTMSRARGVDPVFITVDRLGGILSTPPSPADNDAPSTGE
jgi:hypothetical protein